MEDIDKLEEIKVGGQNINNLRFVNYITMAESKETTKTYKLCSTKRQKGTKDQYKKNTLNGHIQKEGNIHLQNLCERTTYINMCRH